MLPYGRVPGFFLDNFIKKLMEFACKRKLFPAWLKTTNPLKEVREMQREKIMLSEVDISKLGNYVLNNLLMEQ